MWWPRAKTLSEKKSFRSNKERAIHGFISHYNTHCPLKHHTHKRSSMTLAQRLKSAIIYMLKKEGVSSWDLAHFLRCRGLECYRGWSPFEPRHSGQALCGHVPARSRSLWTLWRTLGPVGDDVFGTCPDTCAREHGNKNWTSLSMTAGPLRLAPMLIVTVVVLPQTFRTSPQWNRNNRHCFRKLIILLLLLLLPWLASN